ENSFQTLPKILKAILGCPWLGRPQRIPAGKLSHTRERIGKPGLPLKALSLAGYPITRDAIFPRLLRESKELAWRSLSEVSLRLEAPARKHPRAPFRRKPSLFELRGRSQSLCPGRFGRFCPLTHLRLGISLTTACLAGNGLRGGRCAA